MSHCRHQVGRYPVRRSSRSTCDRAALPPGNRKRIGRRSRPSDRTASTDRCSRQHKIRKPCRRHRRGNKSGCVERRTCRGSRQGRHGRCRHSSRPHWNKRRPSECTKRGLSRKRRSDRVWNSSRRWLRRSCPPFCKRGSAADMFRSCNRPRSKRHCSRRAGRRRDMSNRTRRRYIGASSSLWPMRRGHPSLRTSGQASTCTNGWWDRISWSSKGGRPNTRS
jgi:hypothetical protein